MVIYVHINCSKWSEVDKDISIYRIPAVRKDRGERRDGYLAAISRENLDVNSLVKYRICSRLFISVKPTTLILQAQAGY